MKKSSNHYLDRKEIMRITEFKVEYNFGDKFSKDSFSPEQTTKLKNFLAKKIVNTDFCIKITLLNLK